MNKKHKIFDVGKMWGKKTEKPSQSAFCKGFVYPEPGSKIWMSSNAKNKFLNPYYGCILLKYK